MTVINIALTEAEAYVISDSLVSGIAAPHETSKVLPVAHLGGLLAFCGHGCLVAPTVSSVLLHGRGDMRDPLGWLPAVLQATFAREGLTAPTTVWLVGVVDGAVRGWALTSAAEFQPVELAHDRVHLSPSPRFLLAESPTPAPAEGALAGLRRPEPGEVDDWRPDFASLRQIAREALPVQRAEHPHAIGGRTVSTTITPWGIRTEWDE